MWVNDYSLAYLRAFDRLANGSLARVPADDIRLPGLSSNIELDATSNDLWVGLIWGRGAYDGGVEASCRAPR